LIVVDGNALLSRERGDSASSHLMQFAAISDLFVIFVALDTRYFHKSLSPPVASGDDGSATL